MITILKSQGEPGKVREKISKIFKNSSSHRGVWEVFLIKLINLFLGCFIWSLSLKCVFSVFLHGRLLFIFDLFFNILIISALIVNCVLYLFFFSEHSSFQGWIAYWGSISSILCLLCDSCFLHFESWYEVYYWHEIILFTDACFLIVLKILSSIPMV